MRTRHGGIGLRRESVALPLDRGGQRPLPVRLGVSSATIARASARFSRAVAPDQLDVSFGRRGVGFQLRLDGLGERDDAGETLRERVVDLARQPFAFGGGAGLTGQASALGAGGRQLGDQCGQLSCVAASRCMITVPITGAAITPMRVMATAIGRFGDRMP